jgi:hypothetical protein
MKQIIDGKRYDTETATKLAEWSNSVPVTDFHHMEETLYVTQNGRYFLAGRGGPMTRWSRPEGGGRGAGEGIKPVDRETAREWCETHDFVDVLEEHFSDAIEDA